ncbi:hypothetical protein ACIQI8_22005 [Streptomyces sp. NPDC092369]|uniref:hypothetical protein n=1 Tax=Streptomyces sp. NPDC092369 TaxID=3366015 RepID=UPI003812BC4B
MNWPAALPGAALRVLRTAVGRRALQVALLVGGLFAVGLLCGEQAQAADGVTSGSSARSSTVSSSVHAVGQLLKPRAPAEVKPKKPTRTVKPVAVVDHVVQTVNAGVLEPVGSVVQAVTDEVDDVTAQLPPPASLPILSSLPDLPTLPSSPALPAPPEEPGQTLPAPAPATAPAPAPVAQEPQADSVGHTVGGVRDEGRTGSAEVGAMTYGPVFVVDVDVDADADAGVVGHASTRSVERRVAGVGYAPAHQAPGGAAGDDAVGSRSGIDGGSSRHGDAHAVAVSHRVPLRFVAGAAVRSDAAEIRDGHRDIPVSPA